MVAEVAHILHTSVTDILEMDIHDLLVWHSEAARIAKARYQG